MNSTIVFATAAILGSLLTPLMREAARKLGIVDCPDGRRKLHRDPTPLGGGLGVFLSLVLTAGIAYWWIPEFHASVSADVKFYRGLFGALCVIVLVGVMDDKFRLRGRQKLFGQLAAAAILVGSGLVFRNIRLFDQHIELGLLAIPFSIFWIVGAINALNLIDGMDGLAGSVGLILSLAIGAMALMTGRHADAMLAFALAGGLAGFLRYNLPRASVFLGDAGSMLIGLVLGTLAVRCSLKGPATVALAAPTVIWAVPIFDVCMAIVRRKLTGRSIYETDRGHLHHCLQRSGFSGLRTVATIGLLCVATSVGALASVAYQSEWMAIVSAAAVVLVLVVSGLFGAAEFTLIGTKIRTIGRSLLQVPRTKSQEAAPERARITGTRDWDELWATLVAYAERFDLSSVQLNVTLPSMNEEYHVNWRRRSGAAAHLEWGTDIPLIAGELNVGRLRIRGNPSDGSLCTWMGELISGLRAFESQMIRLVLDEMEEAQKPSQVETAAADELLKVAT